MIQRALLQSFLVVSLASLAGVARAGDSWYSMTQPSSPTVAAGTSMNVRINYTRPLEGFNSPTAAGTVYTMQVTFVYASQPATQCGQSGFTTIANQTNTGACVGPADTNFAMTSPPPLTGDGPNGSNILVRMKIWKKIGTGGDTLFSSDQSQFNTLTP